MEAMSQYDQLTIAVDWDAKPQLKQKRKSEENRSSRFLTRTDTNWVVQLHKIVRGLKFRF